MHEIHENFTASEKGPNAHGKPIKELNKDNMQDEHHEKFLLEERKEELLQRQLQEIKHRFPENTGVALKEEEDDIAIVGVGCLFPGAKNLDEFWRVLVNGENHVKDIPNDRWNNDVFYSENKDNAGKSYVKKAGLLNGHDEWDNLLYGISESEAARLDPQQRYVLDSVHMAMEDGGFTRAHLDGTDTGVYIGCMNDDYKGLIAKDLEEHISYSNTGVSPTLVSARVSYTYNLQGPCMTVDTACSSALVAVHLGCQALHAGDCNLAICGGVNSILSPDIYPSLCRAQMMSAAGQCLTFCDTADGYIRSEGCGIVILKRYKQAVEDFNKIWAIVKTGTNQDGNTVHPITAPSGVQQENLLKKVYHTHNINTASVQYVETHGTGTPVGDPIETNSLGHFFHKYRHASGIINPLLIGSVKTNIGHLESAAGVASLIKVLLMMKYGTLVPSLHVKQDKSNINKQLLIDKYNLDICLHVQEWNKNEMTQRIACVNCFGYGGSNSHAIVIQNTKAECPKVSEGVERLHMICLSGATRTALEENIKALRRDVDSCECDIADIAYTSCLHRDHFNFRTCLVINTKEDIKKQCEIKLGRINELKTRLKRNIIFVYCGVGTTWTGMCQEMMTQNRTFREAIHKVDGFLEPLVGWKISSKFLEQTVYEDPFLNHIAIFACQIALTETWRELGVRPNVIVGQSVGEIAAAYAAGILPLKEAVKVAYHRSRILARHTGGTMMVVGNKAVAETEALCSKFEDVSVGVYISPLACTLTGDRNELANIKSVLEKDTNTTEIPLLIQMLKLKCAYHSRHLESCKNEMIEQLNHLETFNTDITPIVSTVSGCLSKDEDFKTGEYWAQNIRNPVKFMDAIRATVDKNASNIFLEIGPRQVLQAHLQKILAEEETMSLPSMNVKKEISCLYSSISALYEYGVDIVWKSVYMYQQYPAPLPRHNFNRSKKLFIGRKALKHMFENKMRDGGSHMFIKKYLESKEEVFQVLIDKDSTPFVQDHTLSNIVLVPGATYIEVGLHIGLQCLKVPMNELCVSLEFLNPFTQTKEEKRVMNIKTNQVEENSIELEGKYGERIIFRGKVNVHKTTETSAIDLGVLLEECPTFKDMADSYACLERLQYRYGPSLRLVQQTCTSDVACLSKLIVPQSIVSELSKTHFHPAVIDGIFQTFGMFELKQKNVDYLIPRGVQRFIAYGPLQRTMYVYAKQTSETDTEQHFNAVLLSPTGHVIAEVHNFMCQTVESSSKKKEHMYVQKWAAVDFKPDKKPTESKIILGTSFIKMAPLLNSSYLHNHKFKLHENHQKYVEIIVRCEY